MPAKLHKWSQGLRQAEWSDIRSLLWLCYNIMVCKMMKLNIHSREWSVKSSFIISADEYFKWVDYQIVSQIESRWRNVAQPHTDVSTHLPYRKLRTSMVRRKCRTTTTFSGRFAPVTFRKRGHDESLNFRVAKNAIQTVRQKWKMNMAAWVSL